MTASSPVAYTWKRRVSNLNREVVGTVLEGDRHREPNCQRGMLGVVVGR